MKKVAIVGVEGSGKTVMLAGLGELYTRPDENGCFLSPKNFTTASYVADKIARMRRGEWPAATAEDALQGLDWTLKRKGASAARPEIVCQISCLDFAGEVYREAFGIRASEPDSALAGEVESLRAYLRSADELVVLINLRDVIVSGLDDARVQEAMWITNAILAEAVDDSGRKAPRAAIVLSQADSYADTIRACGGAKGVLDRYLPHVANNYGWLDVFTVNAVDRTEMDGEGRAVPARDFSPEGLRPLMDWICGDLVPPRRAAPPAASEDDVTIEDDVPESHLGLWLVVIIAVSLGFIWAAINGKFDDPKEPNVPTSVPPALVPPAPVPPAPEQRPLSAFESLKARAESGDVRAQFELGYAYDHGKNVAQDYAEAVRWYRKAAEQGYAVAQNNLGYAYMHGRGVAQDYAEAVKWLRNAAMQGNSAAQNSLGILYENGQGVARDYDEAFRFYEKSAQAGDMHGQYDLGVMYASGRGVAQDYAEAARWYRKSAEQGLAVAQYNLGYAYENGRGISWDRAEAVRWYRKAAEQGFAEAKAALKRLGEEE